MARLVKAVGPLRLEDIREPDNRARATSEIEVKNFSGHPAQTRFQTGWAFGAFQT